MKLLPFALLGLTAILGMAACSGQGNTSQGGKTSETSQVESGEEEEEKIVITSKDDVKEVVAGGTLQLTASVEGVRWSSRDESVATVDQNGLVTTIKAGSVRIRAEKDGYQTGSFNLTVSKAPDKPAKYTLGLEDADHYDPDDDWGINYGGTYYGNGDSPVEDNGGATPDGTSLGWLQQGCKETLTFTSNKAFEAEIGITCAYNAEKDLATCLSVKFNDAAIDLTGVVAPGPEDGDSNNYYDFHTVSFGKVQIKNGNNVLEIEMIQQGPNMDEFKIFTEEEATITVVKPVVMERITVEQAGPLALEIGGTSQIVTATAGVSYESADTAVATVSASGLITAVAAGTTTITVSKEGMKPASITVRVKAEAPSSSFVLEEGKTVRLELEAATFYCDAGSWGYPQWGIGPSHDGGETPIEDVENASGGMSLGYLSASTTITLKFTSPKAGSVTLKLGAAHNATYDIAAGLSLTIGGVAVDLTGKSFEGTGYTNWLEVDLGTAQVAQGENTLVITCLAQGCNLDYIDVTLPSSN